MNKPDIRFNGFDEEWVEKNLGKICTFSKGHGYSKNDLTSEGTPVYLYGQMYTNYKTILLQSDKFVRPQSGSVYSTGKEVILPASGETPEDIARATAVLAKGIILGGDINIVYPPKELKQEFLALSISYENNKSKLAEQAQGATISHLHGSDIAKLSIAYPSSAEQSKIGNLFSQIDSLISSTQKEHDKLVSLKKCMLQKMFPKKGCLVPEIRFKGFTGDWEEKKISDLATIFIGLVTTMTKYYSNQGTLLIRNSDIKDNYFSFSDNPIYLNQEFADQNSSRKHKIGDVITVHTGDVGTSAVITEKEDGTIGFATIVTRPKTNLLDSMFLSIFLNSDAHKIWAVSVSTGDGRTNYNLGDYTQLLLKIPSLPEQQKIGSYFQNLDNLISKQSAELEKLKNVKKTLLSKMFV